MIPPLHRSSPADARRHHLAWAVWPADLATPVALFLSLRTRGHRPCLLESIEGPERLARYSLVGVDPVAHFRAQGGRATLRTGGDTEVLHGPVAQTLREASRRVLGTSPGHPEQLPPLCGGWIGWFSHEWATELEPTVPRPAADPWNVPDATLELYRDVVAVDHGSQRLFIITACEEGDAGHADAQERIDAMATDALGPAVPCEGLHSEGEWTSSLSDESFRSAVGNLRAAIGQGEIFQAVLSRRFERPFRGDPFVLYRALRLSNPSPHMFFFEADGLTLVGSSPERLVAVRGKRAEIRPIAGTRPRGNDAAEDDRLAAELRGDPKERAEHDMLVDLGRNDLGRVARIGTVRVREYAVLERYTRVQHLVSRVDCELAADADALDALAACFPAGTVSGAPKVRAMQLLAALEPETRGPYAGCFGYLDGTGALDMALIIRCFALREETVTVQAGAGVVFDSDPELEQQETRHKAQALFDAVGEARAPSFQSVPSEEMPA